MPWQTEQNKGAFYPGIEQYLGRSMMLDPLEMDLYPGRSGYQDTSLPCCHSEPLLSCL